MAKIFIKLPQVLKRKFNQDELNAETLKDALEEIKNKTNIPLENCLFTLNNESVNLQGSLEQKLKDKDTLEIILPFAGG